MKKSKENSAKRVSKIAGSASERSNLRSSADVACKLKKYPREKKTRVSKSTTDGLREKERSGEILSQSPIASGVPKNTAVHFGSFYGLEGRSKKKEQFPGNETFFSGPRLEFTWQMVHKLERTAGTEEYARQVSALLEETVEPANFRVNTMPGEDSIPDGRHNPSGFPLWYKEPYKMSNTSEEIRKLLKEKENSKSAKEIFEEESSNDDGDEPEVEENGEESGEESTREEIRRDFEEESTVSSRSTTSTDT